MSCKEELLSAVDRAAENYEFPYWDCGEQNAFVGAMRVSGFVSGQGTALVFETFEHSVKQGVIESLAYAIATFPIPSFVQVGESVQLSVNRMEEGSFPISFGKLEVTSRGKAFSISLMRKALVAAGYLPANAKELTPEAILLQLCESITYDWLFSEPAHLAKMFEMGDGAQRVFAVEAWSHPTGEELYGDLRKPSTYPDIVALVEAACQDNVGPDLQETPNTNWKAQCGPIA